MIYPMRRNKFKIETAERARLHVKFRASPDHEVFISQHSMLHAVNWIRRRPGPQESQTTGWGKSRSRGRCPWPHKKKVPKMLDLFVNHVKNSEMEHVCGKVLTSKGVFNTCHLSLPWARSRDQPLPGPPKLPCALPQSQPPSFLQKLALSWLF